MPNYKDNINTSTSQGGRYAVAGFDPLNHKVSLSFGKTNLTLSWVPWNNKKESIER